MQIKELFLDRYLIDYDSKKYCRNPLFMVGSDGCSLKNIKINEIPKRIDTICDIVETNDLITLNIEEIIFDLKDGNLDFTINCKKSISFDKSTKRGIGEKLEFEDFNDIDINDFIFQSICANYLYKICETNENVFKFISRKNLKLSDFLYVQTSLVNILNVITFNLLELEKLINSKNENILIEGIHNDNFELSEASKLHQVLGLPKVAISVIKDLKLEYAMDEIKLLAEALDGNSLRIFFEFLANFKVILKSSKTSNEDKISKFIEDFIEVSNKGYRTPDLLRYIMKQNFYYSLDGVFSFPFVQMGFLKDYIHMSEIYGVKVEKYPSQLKRQHDILASNIEFFDKLNPVLEQQFKDAVDTYKDVEKEITINLPCEKGETPSKETYVFIVPTCIKDIIQEGSDLHHCVGSYSDRIIEGKSRIVFMRLKNSPKESLVTIDISKDKKLIEAAGMGNSEITSIQEKALNKWLKEIS